MTGWSGGAFGARGQCLLAPNPGIMTLDGTNTWVLQEPGSPRSVVIDPGPIEDGHLERLVAETDDVGLVLLTHHHFDHSEVAQALAEQKDCAVRAFDPAYCFRADPLVDGEVVEIDGLVLKVVHVPGHTADSVAFHLAADSALLTGDMVLGRGTTVVAHPDGQLGSYRASIERMRALVDAEGLTALWPAHGPVLDAPAAVLDFYLAHRRERLEQVASALTRLQGAEPLAPDELPRRVVEIVYADVDEALWGAAELSVQAQLAYLEELGTG